MTMILSSTMVNVAVPSIMGTYGVGQSQAQWMSTAFLSAMTASQLLGAWVTSIVGPRGGYIGAVALFIGGSLLGAAAPNMDMLIASRTLQGMAAGVVQPIAMVTIFRVFPTQQRGMALAVYGMGIMLAPIMGPVVGGITIDAMGWRYLFFIPLPIAGLALMLGSLFMPAREAETERLPFDWAGYGLIVGAIVCTMSAIAGGPRDGWFSDKIMFLGLVGISLFVAFVVSQLRSKAPILDFSVFRHKQFAAAAALGFVFGAGNFASTYIVPVFVQTVQNFTPTAAGLVSAPAGLVVMLFFPIAGRMVDTFPAYILTIVGLLLFALGALLLHQTDVNTAFVTLVIYVIVGRIGQSIMLPAINVSALGALPPEKLNNGSGTINFIRLMGGAFGVNLLVVFMEERTDMHAVALTVTQTYDNAASRELLNHIRDLLSHGGAPEGLLRPGSLHFLGRVIEAQANTLGFKDGFMMIAIVFVCALVPALMLRNKQKK
ncbi:MAG: DHA2 family efflux MFS transporter permease subunit [Rhodospirillaceae bacterium]|nr:DHA2 family efflux MFS transporter permease subunit [Rhodospirillaceae bacterium]MBT3493952.1 DHA2 family efflux MFS transporter permease subunit [Rhodospirillaceae bacterium]MBT3780821.1 DHA2 family efflux MFS transporter permease subunit [Rhodospirillaceae bacterium]MBT3976248.1 DHA2 family efflux MFS transporter permease subunit [Rhodospirillaceae bacterium]MBT4167497.1 DHA2 family efflux MFS transporter permease subunit [Rhodospirillaceae bacterium]